MKPWFVIFKFFFVFQDFVKSLENESMSIPVSKCVGCGSILQIKFPKKPV